MLHHFTARWVLPPLLAWAAAGQTDAQTPSQRGSAITRETLVAFAEAYLDIVDINTTRDQRARADQNPQQVARLEEQADSAIQRALAERDLTRDDYEAVEEVLGIDAEMRQEFELILARVRRDRGAATTDTVDTQPTRNPGTP